MNWIFERIVLDIDNWLELVVIIKMDLMNMITINIFVMAKEADEL